MALRSLTGQEARAIFERVKANHAKLEACPCHLFAAPEDADISPGRAVECLHCHGEMQLCDAHIYVKGYEAAGGNGAVVWPWLYRDTIGDG